MNGIVIESDGKHWVIPIKQAIKVDWIQPNTENPADGYTFSLQFSVKCTEDEKELFQQLIEKLLTPNR